MKLGSARCDSDSEANDCDSDFEFFKDIDLKQTKKDPQEIVDKEKMRQVSTSYGCKFFCSSLKCEKNLVFRFLMSEYFLFYFQLQEFRQQYRIHVGGSNIPSPVDSFHAMQTEHGMSDKLLKNIEASGYQCPTPIQMQALPVMLQVGSTRT